MGAFTWTKGFRRGILVLTALSAFGLALTFDATAADWNTKETKSAFIGVYPEDIDAEEREALEYTGKGILVEDVVEDGPADKAGLKAGDIITKIDAENVSNSEQFRELLAKHSPGDKIKVNVLRKGKSEDITVELSERKNVEYSFNFKHGNAEKRGFLGVVTETVEGDFAKYFGVEEGALIKKVVEDSPAEKAGLKPGDVLVKIGSDEIEETDDVSEAMQDHQPGDQVNVKYFRQGKETSVDVKLDASRGSTWKMSKSDGHRIIISDDDEIVVDTDELHEAIREVMEDLRINFDDGKEDMKEELEKLKVEIEKMKTEMEAKKK